MIVVKDINKSFDQQQVLHNVSCTFRPGMNNLIIGQSGSGKTVLLKCLIGLHSPDSGQILANDLDITQLSDKQLKTFHRQVGVLFQGSALFDSMTVAENVAFPLVMFSNKTVKERDERVKFCLDRVGMSQAYNKFPDELSGGMQKRAAIARAIALNPKFLFCDEPNSGLDPKTSLVIDALIQDITKEYNICTIVNSHDMNSIMEIGDNIVFLKGGKKEWQGSRHEIMNSENEALNDFVFASELFKKIKNK